MGQTLQLKSSGSLTLTKVWDTSTPLHPDVQQRRRAAITAYRFKPPGWELLFPGCLPQVIQKLLLWLYESIQLVPKWHARWNDTKRTFLYTAGQKEAPQREMPCYPGSFTSTKSLALAAHDPGRSLWKPPGHCRAGEQTEVPGSSSRNRYFSTNFHDSSVIGWLLTRKVVKCLRAVKGWQGDVWDVGAAGRNWELMSQWVVS